MKNFDDFIKKLFRPSIRYRLILSLLSVVMITGISSIILGSMLINRNILGQAYERVQSDLMTARYIYDDRIKVIHLFLKHLSSLTYVKDAVIRGDRNLLKNKLAEVKTELNLDILNITDSSGKIISRAGKDLPYGDDVSGDDIIRHVLNNKNACMGSGIIEREYLQREETGLAGRVYINIIETSMGRKREKLFEDRALALKAAVPVFQNGRVIGIIYGARLLNNNFELVDRIKSLIFKDEKLDGYDVGTATVFLDDIRISTNVKNSAGERAVGTQVSKAVYQRVVENRELWLDKAFVVNNWYISAYSPIYDIENNVIGILYVGILEEKYNILKRYTILYYLLITLISALIAGGLSIYLIKSFIVPIKKLVENAREIAKGNYQMIEYNARDEMGYLCSNVNRMVSAIVERDKKLKEQTERQIVQSEKLASLGRLASGIAHEINNPLTGVLCYSGVLYEELENTRYEEDIRIIMNETIRCREIVKGILEFSRETSVEKTLSNINKLITDTLSILERHFNFQNIKIIKKLSEEIPAMNLDVNQIRSLISNLAVNAADAMPNGGELMVSTEYNKTLNIVTIVVKDTGTGISQENIGKIFDPFFTTKETGKGTGLGLSVSFGIVKGHKGSIEVESQVGKGTSFIITLPVN